MNSVAARSRLLATIDLRGVTRLQPGLRLQPGAGLLTLSGAVELGPVAPPLPLLSRRFTVKIQIPDDFPNRVPRAWAIDDQIPKNFHRLDDGSFCFGSPMEVRRHALEGFPSFLTSCVMPYLYGWAYFEATGSMPFGERPHGPKGLVEAYEDLFRVRGKPAVFGCLEACGLRRRVANRRPCPCGSCVRLGKCHHTVINHHRTLLGRSWFRRHWTFLLDQKAEISIARKAKRHALRTMHRPPEQCSIA